MICQPKMLDGRTEILRKDARAIAEFIETRLARFPEEDYDIYVEILEATDFYFSKGDRVFSEINCLPPALLFEICRILNERTKIGDALVESAVDSWENYVVPGNPPEMERADSTTQRWVAERFPANVAPIERATDAEEALMREYLDAKNAKLEAEAALEQVETRLKLAIGERDGIFSDNYGKVTWKRCKDSRRVDYRAVVDELKPSAETLERFAKTVPGVRRFETKSLKYADA